MIKYFLGKICKMPAIKETKIQMIQHVFPEYANSLGTLHGGRLMNWIMIVGGLAASKIAKGTTVLGTTDSIDFINPVKIGEIVVLDSWVEYVGKSSLEVGVRVHSENTETGEKKFTTSSHLAYVAVGKEGKPRTIKERITPANEVEELIYIEAQKRREERFLHLAQNERNENDIENENEELSWRLETLRVVLPEDALYGNLMSVGKLMMDIDETAAILAARFVRGVIVTGSVDNLHLYSPIRVGEVITLKAGLNYVGNTSIEVGIRVISEDLITGSQNNTGTAFLNFIHIGEDGRPRSVPRFTPKTPTEIRYWKEAEDRRKRRTERVKQIRKSAYSSIPDYIV
jgi:acyl-CoA hydrolase